MLQQTHLYKDQRFRQIYKWHCRVYIIAYIIWRLSTLRNSLLCNFGFSCLNNWRDAQIEAHLNMTLKSILFRRKYLHYTSTFNPPPLIEGDVEPPPLSSPNVDRSTRRHPQNSQHNEQFNCSDCQSLQSSSKTKFYVNFQCMCGQCT